MAVRLSSNESNHGPSPAAVAAARDAADRMHLYPDDQSLELRTRIAAEEGVDVGQVTMGTGSAALLVDVVGHACRDGGSVLAHERAFVVYRLAARNAGAPYVEAPIGGPATLDAPGYGRDTGALLERIDDETRIVLVDNPANPTGDHLDADALATLVAGVPEHVTLVVDEAYWQYASGRDGYVRARELGVTHPRLVVTSTFSKAHALAGLRVGYALGAEELVTAIDAWRPRFNVNAVAQAAALASLDDRAHLARAVAATVAARATMAQGLREIGVPFTDGLGNFLTIELGTAAAPVVEAFAAHGIGVRPLVPYGLGEQVRVSVGTDDEVAAFLTAAGDVLADVPSRR